MIATKKYTSDLTERRDQIWELGRECGLPILYICLPAELDIMLHDLSAGFYSPALSALVQKSAPQMWRGDGPGFVVGMPQTDTPESATEVFSAICCHELAHLVDDITRSEYRKHTPAEGETLLKVDFKEDSPIVDSRISPPWLAHEWRFVRALLHCQRRFVLADIELPVDESIVFAHEFYGLSRLEQFRECLRPELDERQDEPLPDAMRGYPPAAFMNRFADDVERWQALHILESRVLPAAFLSFDHSSEEPLAPNM